FFFQAEDGIRDKLVTGVQTCALPILLNSRAVRGAKSSKNIELMVESGGNSQAIVGSHLLVAAGRVPNTDSLKLSAAGIATDKREIGRAAGRGGVEKAGAAVSGKKTEE